MSYFESRIDAETLLEEIEKRIRMHKKFYKQAEKYADSQKKLRDFATGKKLDVEARSSIYEEFDTFLRWTSILICNGSATKALLNQYQNRLDKKIPECLEKEIDEMDRFCAYCSNKLRGLSINVINSLIELRYINNSGS